MSDREALAAALGYADAGKIAVTSTETFGPLETMYAAARERLAQLPEKCGTCEGSGKRPGGYVNIPCPTCHGSGKVYPEEIQRRIAEVLDAWAPDLNDYAVERFTAELLAALNGETP